MPDTILLLKDLLIKNNIVEVRQKHETPFTLKSRKESRLFVNIKEASINPVILNTMVKAILEKYSWMRNEILSQNTTVIGSVALGAVPIGTALSLKTGIHQIIIRTEVHKSGKQNKIIGDCNRKIVMVIDDVATTGSSIIEATKAVSEAGGFCDCCLVIVDREEGAKALCEEYGINLSSLFKKSELLGDIND